MRNHKVFLVGERILRLRCAPLRMTRAVRYCQAKRSFGRLLQCAQEFLAPGEQWRKFLHKVEIIAVCQPGRPVHHLFVPGGKVLHQLIFCGMKHFRLQNQLSHSVPQNIGFCKGSMKQRGPAAKATGSFVIRCSRGSRNVIQLGISFCASEAQPGRYPQTPYWPEAGCQLPDHNNSKPNFFAEGH